MGQEMITVKARPEIGKAANRTIRKEGCVPAVIYGLGKDPQTIAILAKTVARIIASDTGMNSMVEMACEGTDARDHVIIKEVARNPVTGRLVHVDFMRVDPTHKVRVKVPLRLTGTPLGVKEGGMLDFIHREIEVECLPSFIPAHIDIDVSAMVVDDTLRMHDLTLDAHLTLLGDPHNTICIIHGKQAEIEETPAAEGAAAPVAPEPVVAGKK
jgi:large subunit ribosomal protein L25